MRLHIYFSKVLGYGNKCEICQKQGLIILVTRNAVGFQCLRCHNNWIFETKEKISDLLLKTFGI